MDLDLPSCCLDYGHHTCDSSCPIGPSLLPGRPAGWLAALSVSSQSAASDWTHCQLDPLGPTRLIHWERQYTTPLFTRGVKCGQLDQRGG